MKNPKWHRDELILTLNLYFNLNSNSFTSTNLKIIELSNILKKLPIYSHEQRNSDFRNANGVNMKLGNFTAIDPNNSGMGLTRCSKLDKQTFFEFQNKKDDLKKIAEIILETLNHQETVSKLYNIENEHNEIIHEGFEGEVILKLHKVRERNSNLSNSKKVKVLKETGKLQCEACKFDFFETYGELGKGYIECHHNKPLSTYDVRQKTTLNDLALVCSNCHKMIHRNNGDMSIKGIVNLMKQSSSLDDI